jgi:hypothetical protein
LKKAFCRHPKRRAGSGHGEVTGCCTRFSLTATNRKPFSPADKDFL